MNILLTLLLVIVIYYLLTTGFKTAPAGLATPNITPQASISTPILTNSSNIIETALNNVGTGVNNLVTEIINTAQANNLNPAILYGIVSAEQGTTNPNNWDTAAYNPNDPSGAYGLTQVLGATAQSLGVNPQMLLQSPSMSLNTTAQYILKYTPPTSVNNISVVAGIYNGGPAIFNEIQNGTVNASTTNAVGTYIENASNGFNYFNQTYANTQ